LFILGWIPKGGATASATAPPWSWPNSSMSRWWTSPSSSWFSRQPVAGRGSACHIVLNISRSHLCHRLAMAVAVVIHTHTHNRHPPAAPGLLEVPRSCHLSAFCDWNWRPQLQITVTSDAWPRRGDDERSLFAA
jgi:hypothetical protein